MIRIAKGDITQVSCDAIVNPANSYGYMGGGVAGAIKRKGGEEIEREVISKAPIEIGKAVATTAGKLKSKYIIHAPTMERPAMRIDVSNVRKAVKAALELAKDLGIKRIAFPGMGTGVGGVSYEEAAHAMMDIIKDFKKYFEEILLIDINDQMVEAWKRNLPKD